MKGLADIQVTLYDIFGYLLPGLVTLGALTIFSWAVFAAGTGLSTPRLSGAWWIAIFVASYLLGHLIQAIANLAAARIARFGPSALAALDWAPHGSAIPDRLGFGTRPDAKAELWAQQVIEAADVIVAQDGKTEDRTVYQYREGFYRGLTVAFTLAFAAVVVRAFVGGDALLGRHTFITTGEYSFAAATLFLAVVLSHNRWHRFYGYKAHNTLVAFASLVGLIAVPGASVQA
jgi:hypothetical protein